MSQDKTRFLCSHCVHCERGMIEDETEKYYDVLYCCEYEAEIEKPSEAESCKKYKQLENQGDSKNG